MMLTNIQALDYISDKYYYKGTLFTGASFRIDGEEVKVLNEFENGVIVGLNKCQYFPNETNMPHIHIDYIDFPGEYLDFPAFYKSEKFTGIAYEFSDDESVCLAKHLFKNGSPVGSMAWYSSGEIRSLKLERQGISQFFAWFIDGSLEALNLYSIEQHERLIYIVFDEYKRLETVWIKENYFEWIKQHRTDIEFHHFETKNSFDSLAVSLHLFLIDGGVDDSVLNSIAANDGLKGLSKITLSRTSLSEEAMVELANIMTVAEIEIKDSQRDLLTVVQRIKLKRPDCLVKI